MTATVHLVPSGRQFSVEPGQTLLESALRAGIPVPYGCSDGRCGECKARVLSGAPERVRFHDYVLSAADKANGCTLLCAYTVSADAQLEVSYAQSLADIPAQRVPAKLQALVDLSPNLVAADVKIQRGRVFRFFAGQRAVLDVGGQFGVELPIASCPCDGTRLRFFLPRQPSVGAVCDVHQHDLYQQLTCALQGGRTRGAKAFRGRLEVRGPAGGFVLDEQSTRPLLFVCFDSAFASVHSLVEHAMNLELPQAMRIYRVGPDANTPFLHNECRAWADAWDDLVYRNLNANCGAGREPTREQCAEIAAEIARDCPDLGGHDAYVTGPAAFVNVMGAQFMTQGVPRERLFADVY